MKARPLNTGHYPRLCSQCGIVHRPAVKHCPYCGKGHIFHNRCAQKHKKAKTPVQEKLW